MGRNIQEISAKIDKLAEQGCRILNQEEKEKFFQECSNIKRCYTKGKRKGEERDIYDIDGRCFNEIWKEIYPYVFKSCLKSVYYDNIEAEDAISEVKLNLFSILTRFGPVFQNQTLSQRLSVIVNISLTNYSNKKDKRLKTVSINVEDEDGNQESEKLRDPNDNMQFIDFWCDIPQRIQPFVEHLIFGSSMSETQKFFGNSNKIKKELVQFASRT